MGNSDHSVSDLVVQPKYVYGDTQQYAVSYTTKCVLRRSNVNE